MNQQLITINSKTAVDRYGDEGQIRLEMQIMRAAVPGLNAKKRAKVNGQWVETNDYVISDELVLALYIAKKSSGLSPERGEIYATPNGLYVAAKVRAYDAITAAGWHGETLSIIFKTVVPDTPLWQGYAKEYMLEKTDTVRMIEVISNKRHMDWLDQRAGYIKELKLLDYERREIVEMVNEKYGTMCAPMVAIGVVKGSEELGDKDYKTGEIKAQKAAVYSRTDRADKRALSRWIAKYGYASPDTRNYGGVQIEKDEVDHSAAIDGDFKVKPGVQVEEPALIEADTPPEPQTATAEERHEDNKKALGRVDDDDPDAPFGMSETPKAAQSNTRADAQKRIAEQAETAKDLVSKLSQANAENEARELDAELNTARGVYGKRASSIAELDRAADALQKANTEAQQALDKLAASAETLPLI